MKAVLTIAPALISPCSDRVFILPTEKTDNALFASVPTAFDEYPRALETRTTAT